MVSAVWTSGAYLRSKWAAADEACTPTYINVVISTLVEMSGGADSWKLTDAFNALCASAGAKLSDDSWPVFLGCLWRVVTLLSFHSVWLELCSVVSWWLSCWPTPVGKVDVTIKKYWAPTEKSSPLNYRIWYDCKVYHKTVGLINCGRSLKMIVF